MTESSITLLKRVRQTPPASLKEMMKENLINLFYNQIVEKYLQKYIETQDPAFVQTMVGFSGLVRNYDRWNIHVQAYPHKERQALKDLMEELERIHRYRINNKEVKEQITAYLSRLDETEKKQRQVPERGIRANVPEQFPRRKTDHKHRGRHLLVTRNITENHSKRYTRLDCLVE